MMCLSLAGDTDREQIKDTVMVLLLLLTMA